MSQSRFAVRALGVRYVETCQQVIAAIVRAHESAAALQALLQEAKQRQAHAREAFGARSREAQLFELTLGELQQIFATMQKRAMIHEEEVQEFERIQAMLAWKTRLREAETRQHADAMQANARQADLLAIAQNGRGLPPEVYVKPGEIAILPLVNAR